ncbi:MAG: EamA family transporter, partial [Rhodocyclaceae bacterium]|nr:EamA family transporter [Rhodocyclaceae bacterium]
VLTIGSYALVLWAMTVASIPAVAALRETSVIFAAILGAWLLKERMGRWRIAGAVLVALGAIAIRWS